MNVEKKFCCLFIDLFCRNNFFTVTFDQCNPHLTKILKTSNFWMVVYQDGLAVTLQMQCVSTCIFKDVRVSSQNFLDPIYYTCI